MQFDGSHRAVHEAGEHKRATPLLELGGMFRVWLGAKQTWRIVWMGCNFGDKREKRGPILS